MYKTIKITYNIHQIFFRKSFLILVLVISLPFLSICQKNKNIYQSISNYRGYSIFYTAISIPKIDYNPLVDYYWYLENEIHTTKGAIGGKPLNGEFISYYLNNNLKENGSFYYGLKINKWQYWFDNGNMQRIENYRNGLLEGSYYVYNNKNQIITSGKYKSNKKNGIWNTYDNKTGVQLNSYTWENDILNGKFIVYNDNSTIKGNYNKGKLDGKYIITKNNKDTVLYYKNGVEYLKKPKIKKTNPTVMNEKPIEQKTKDTLSRTKGTNKFSFKKLFHRRPHVDKTKTVDKEKAIKKNKEINTAKNIKKNTKKKSFFGLFAKNQKTDIKDTIPTKNSNLKNIHK